MNVLHITQALGASFPLSDTAFDSSSSDDELLQLPTLRHKRKSLLCDTTNAGCGSAHIGSGNDASSTVLNDADASVYIHSGSSSPAELKQLPTASPVGAQHAAWSGKDDQAAVQLFAGRQHSASDTY